MLAAGAEVDARTEDLWAWTPLMIASGNGGSAYICNLLPEPRSAAPLEQPTHYRPLHRATDAELSDYLDIMKSLLDHGASVDARSEERTTPLMVACRDGSAAACRLLLDRGADAEAMNNAGFRPLHHATSRRDTDFDQAGTLLSHGVNINARTAHGSTPLMFAKHPAICELLLKNGADTEIRDGWRWTAVHIAAKDGHAWKVELLLAHDADANARTPDGATASTIAWDQGVRDFLRKHGSEISSSPAPKVPWHMFGREIALLERNHSGRRSSSDDPNPAILPSDGDIESDDEDTPTVVTISEDEDEMATRP